MGIAHIALRTSAALLVAAGAIYVFALLAGAPVGYTFATETGVNLTVNSHTTYNGTLMPELSWEAKDLTPGIDTFFNFGDIKPGDFGESTISLHVEEAPAWICLVFDNLVGADNSTNEPESLEDINGLLQGELA